MTKAVRVSICPGPTTVSVALVIPRLLLSACIGKEGRDIGKQRRLVGFQRQDVVPATAPNRLPLLHLIVPPDLYVGPASPRPDT